MAPKRNCRPKRVNAARPTHKNENEKRYKTPEEQEKKQKNGKKTSTPIKHEAKKNIVGTKKMNRNKPHLGLPGLGGRPLFPNARAGGHVSNHLSPTFINNKASSTPFDSRNGKGSRNYTQKKAEPVLFFRSTVHFEVYTRTRREIFVCRLYYKLTQPRRKVWQSTQTSSCIFTARISPAINSPPRNFPTRNFPGGRCSRVKVSAVCPRVKVSARHL